MRSTASVLHVDLDAFFASVEQRDKPSLRNKPVVVGGLGPRGVVATASYEARGFGVRSAMPMAEARARCPHAAFLGGRFDAYRSASRIVMSLLRRTSAVVQPLSLDEAFVDLRELNPADLDSFVAALRADITESTHGLTASVGVGSSKLIAKIATELGKPDGAYIVAPGTEQALLAPMQVTAITGVGPATAERLRRIGIHTVAQLRDTDEDELIRTVGKAAGHSLWQLSRAQDHRPVVAERETKSVSAEDTFPGDITDRGHLEQAATYLAHKVAMRLRRCGLSARTITLKVRHHDFQTHTRAITLAGPTDSPTVLARTARSLLSDTEVAGGLRLLGVAASALSNWVQEDLFTAAEPTPELIAPKAPAEARTRRWLAGMDIQHSEYGDGWVWGSGAGRVTVRFETRTEPDGPVRTFAIDDPLLRPGHGEIESGNRDTVSP